MKGTNMLIDYPDRQDVEEFEKKVRKIPNNPYSKDYLN